MSNSETAQKSRDAVILVVDDESDNAELVRRSLQQRSEIRCILAFSGTEAISLLGTTSVDILVVDYRMPHMTGVELIERVKFMGRKVSCIMLTAYPYEPEVIEAQRDGLVQCVIAKPWKADDLLLAIDFALGMKKKKVPEPK